jgi:hypothetical protein
MYGNLVYGGLQSPAGTEMGAFVHNGAVHRAVHTHDLHGTDPMGGLVYGNLVYGADEGGEMSLMDRVSSMASDVMEHIKANWMGYTVAGVVALLVLPRLMKGSTMTFANRRKRRRKGTGRKGRRSAAQIRAAKRNLAKARRAAAGRKGRKSRRGKRKVTPYNLLWGKYRKMGYSAKQAARMAKGGKAPAKGKGRKSRGRRRSRR